MKGNFKNGGEHFCVFLLNLLIIHGQEINNNDVNLIDSQGATANHKYSSQCHTNGTCSYSFSWTLHNGENNNVLQEDSPFIRSLEKQLVQLNQAIGNMTKSQQGSQSDISRREIVNMQKDIKEVSEMVATMTQDDQEIQTQLTAMKKKIQLTNTKLLKDQNRLQKQLDYLKATVKNLELKLDRINVVQTGRAAPGTILIARPESSHENIRVAVGQDCASLYKSGLIDSGDYHLQPDPNDNSTSFFAYCDMDTDGGGWTVIQRREDGLENFDRNWEDYKKGFGKLESEHWLGLQKMYLLNKYGNNVIRFDMWKFNNRRYYAEYQRFKLSDESDGYRIKVGRFHGNAGDSFHYANYYLRQDSQRFSTKDRDNDSSGHRNCASLHKGGWWYYHCAVGSLNGLYYNSEHGYFASRERNGIMWQALSASQSLMKTEIKVRPADF